MSNDTAAPLALLPNGRLVSVIATNADGLARVYHLAFGFYTYEPAADLIYPTATPAIKLTTEAQRIVCCYRFQDIPGDLGAELDGRMLRITNPLLALETLDLAIDVCDDNAAGGDAKYRREAATTRRLRDRVFAAVTTAAKA